MFAAGSYTLGIANNNGGEQIDPRREDVLATTDAQPQGSYLCQVTITATSLDDSKALCEIQHRDATDDETNPLESLVVAVPVDDTRQFECAFTLEQDERVTVVPYTDMIGTVMAAINWQRVA
jgi:hypothetical protein